ncbi:MAG TPA: type I pullulanase, partial [Symbiobacteriaceae bacterium]|nr:type I pullulanase [Symbiobacteriaceae bacterium]
GSEFKFTEDAGGGQQWLPSNNIQITLGTGSGKGTKEVVITLAQDADVSKEYTLQHESLAAAPIQKRGVLNDPAFIYTGNDMGAVWTAAATTFRLWAPTVSGVEVLIYSGPEGGSPTQTLPMTAAEGGTWFAKATGNLEGQYYTYRIKTGTESKEVVDPYAIGAGVNGNRGLIVNLTATNPAGWESTERPPFKNPTDAILYEMHVRDLTTHPSSGAQQKGKFLGLVEAGTKGPSGVATGLDHVKELGITHIHLLPSFDYASVDEKKSDQFNWGYDPKNFNVPEGSYATDPNGGARIKEFKQMVQSFHQNGIRVVMDVVYNHTSAGASPFEAIAPTYYYRYDATGKLSNGSGTGNETASERPMMRKYIVDSVKYWATAYKVDGFRFDLMALHDIETMKQVRAALDAIDPSILIYGEPWTGGSTPLPESERLVKGNQKNLGIAVFNDNIRNAIKGDNDGVVKGFATGAGGQDSGVMRGVVGGIDFDDRIGDFTAQPSESINYVSAHDNLTLWDKIAKSNAQDSEADRIKMDLFAQAIVFTSQGIPFMQGGEEMLRTKGGNHNSYNAPDAVNQLDWNRKAQYAEAFNYYKGLIAVRKAHPSFRLMTADQVKKALTFLDAPMGAVAFRLDGSVAGDNWKQIVVIYNPQRQAITVDLPGAG